MLKLKKRCTKCKKTKPLDEFYPVHHGRYLMSECKECYKGRISQFGKNHLEEFRIRKRIYVSKNPEKWAKYAKEWQNSDRWRVYVKIRYFRKKLKDEFSMDYRVNTKKKTLQQLKDIHGLLKKQYQFCKRKKKECLTTD